MYYLFTGSTDENGIEGMTELVKTFNDITEMYRFTMESNLTRYWWGQMVNGTMHCLSDN
jgi:hypothetical protein